MKEIQRVSVTDSVIQDIKELILSGEYPSKSKLPTENEMCQTMKVSRTCVREAIRVLQALKMVDIIPGKGAFVSASPFGASEPWYDVPDSRYSDFMDVRMAIEPISTVLAIQRASKRQINKLVRIHQSFLSAVTEKSPTKLVMFDELFHSEIVNISGNPLLLNINKQLSDANRKYRVESWELYQNAVEPHAHILQCFYDKDPEQGQAEMVKHLQITRQDTAKLLTRQRE